MTAKDSSSGLGNLRSNTLLAAVVEEDPRDLLAKCVEKKQEEREATLDILEGALAVIPVLWCGSGSATGLLPGPSF